MSTGYWADRLERPESKREFEDSFILNKNFRMANPIDDFRELFFTIADKSMDGEYVSIQNIW